jgi:hypothetical protein
MAGCSTTYAVASSAGEALQATDTAVTDDKAHRLQQHFVEGVSLKVDCQRRSHVSPSWDGEWAQCTRMGN